MSGTSERRAFVLVIDACGVGALPDAASYGDAGTNTLGHVAEAVGGLELPVFEKLGLGLILPLRGVPASAECGVHGRLHPLGPGKDSVSGHWELMGVVMEQPLPTYPEGFPAEVIDRLVRATGYQVICNRPYDGVAAIEDFGEEHLRSGAPIIYTSQDSVLQVAAHVERLSVPELYRACEAMRAVMRGEHAVGRVIARPFIGAVGSFLRTPGRRDFAVPPPTASYLEELSASGAEVHGVGKVSDLFAGVGVGESHPGASNTQALSSVEGLVGTLGHGLVFANLVETDQVHGHRKDVHGFASALTEIDATLARWLGRLRADDLLIVTADHGVDPAHAGSDHTREYVPLLAATGVMLAGHGSPMRHDGPMADVGATVLDWLAGESADALPGHSFLDGGAA